MNVLWRLCQNICKNDLRRKKIFLFLNTVLFCLIGFAVWLIVRQRILSTWDWAAVFAGGSGYGLGFLGGAIYLYNV